MGAPCITVLPVKADHYTPLIQEAGNSRDVQQKFGIRPSTLYHWDKQGKVKSVLVSARKAGRGIRIYDFHSIRQLLGLVGEEVASK
jgi:hypothetical protein